MRLRLHVLARLAKAVHCQQGACRLQARHSDLSAMKAEARQVVGMQQGCVACADVRCREEHR